MNKQNINKLESYEACDIKSQYPNKTDDELKQEGLIIDTFYEVLKQYIQNYKTL